MDYEKYMSCIPTGKENAIHAEQLYLLWGCKNDREGRLIVEKLRLAGYLILSDHNGYCQPADENMSDIKAYVKLVKRRIRTARATIKHAENALKSHEKGIDGQMCLTDWENELYGV